MGKLLLGAAAALASLTLTGAVAAAQSGDVSVDASGPGAQVKVISKDKVRATVNNTTSATVNNTAYQKATSGDAKVTHSTTGGNATSGKAGNTAALSVSGTINNSSSLGDVSCGCAGMSGAVNVDASGPDSKVTVMSKDSTKITVNNTSNLSVNNKVTQTAYSGDASVTGNTTGGNATSGDASNSTTASVSFSVTN